MLRSKMSRAVATGVLCGAAVSPVLGVPTFYILQEDARFIQTGPSASVSDGFTFQGRATPNDGVGPIDFNGGTITFPAASALSTSPLGPVGAELRFSSGKVNQATFQADFPEGNYAFHLTDSANAPHTQDETVSSSIVAAPATVGLLSSTSFNALQGMDASKAITLNFNAFTDANPSALIFFAVQDSVGNTPVFDGLQPNVTQEIIPANTLTPGKSYSYFIFFDNVAISADNNAEVLKDTRTQGSFATAPVPEPASCVVMGCAAVGLIFGRRRAPRGGARA